MDFFLEYVILNYEVINLKKGLSIAAFVLGVVIALCGAAVTVLSTISMDTQE
jgi:hypothetical protein